MFRCQKSGRLTKPGEKMKKIVLETRERVYMDEDGYEIGRGWEIVREISVSDRAYQEWLDEQKQEALRANRAAAEEFERGTGALPPPGVKVPFVPGEDY